MTTRSWTPERCEALFHRAREAQSRAARTWDVWQRWWLMWDHMRRMPPHECLVPLCAFCRRFRDEEGEWHELPPGVSDRFHMNGPLQATHGLCDDCVGKFRAGSQAAPDPEEVPAGRGM
jgi:hypothetical protein